MSFFSKRASRHAEAFETRLRPHLEPLYRLAYRLTGRREDAEDLVQDLLTKLYARREELEKVEHPRSWLMRVLYRLFIDQRRQRARSPLHLVPDGPSGDGESILERLADSDRGPAAETERDDQQRLLLAAIARLSEDHRRVLALHDVEGYTLEEMQEMIDCPIGTLKSRLHRARARLRDLLAESADDMEPSESPVRHNSHSA